MSPFNLIILGVLSALLGSLVTYLVLTRSTSTAPSSREVRRYSKIMVRNRNIAGRLCNDMSRYASLAGLKNVRVEKIHLPEPTQFQAQMKQGEELFVTVDVGLGEHRDKINLQTYGLGASQFWFDTDEDSVAAASSAVSQHILKFLGS